MFAKEFSDYLEKKIKGKHQKVNSNKTGDNETSFRFNGSELMKNINNNNILWDIPTNESISSHRRTVGKGIVFGKKIVRKLLYWLVTRPLIQQKEFNGSVTRSLNELVTTQQGLIDAYNDSMEKLVQNNNYLIQQISSLNEKNDSLSRQLQNTNSNINEKESFPVNYKKFEDMFRGDEEEIVKTQVEVYSDYLKDKESLLDLGCGRGEFLQKFNNRGIDVLGVDIDKELAEYCSIKGLPVLNEDIFAFLERNQRKFDAITCFHVIEHLYPYQIIEMVNKVYSSLNEEGLAIFETPNPECLYNLAYGFTIDMSHKKLVHSYTLKFIMEEVGFRDVKIKHLAPVEESVSLVTNSKNSIEDENFKKLNNLLFGYQNYAIIGRK